MESFNVYHYPYGGFAFVKLYESDRDNIVIAYNFYKRSIMSLSYVVTELCQVVDTISASNLLELLLFCLETNLGYMTLTHNLDLKHYLKNHKLCEEQLTIFITNLVKNNSLQEYLKDTHVLLLLDFGKNDKRTMNIEAIINNCLSE